MMETVLINVGKLRRRDDARRIDRDAVAALAASIREVGIIHPLRVRRTPIFEHGREGDGYEVIVGSHRLEASRDVPGLFDLPCVVVEDDDDHAELAMIDENLCRAELSPADRASQTTKRKIVYERIHPETRSTSGGGGGRNNATRRQLGDDIAERFTGDTASATGKSERTVQRDAERGEKISDEALALVAGTVLDTGTYLDKLKSIDPEEQENQVKRDLAKPRKEKVPAERKASKIDGDVKDRASVEIAGILSEHVPSEWWDALKSNLYAAGAANIANAFTNITGQSIMDRRYGA